MVWTDRFEHPEESLKRTACLCSRFFARLALSNSLGKDGFNAEVWVFSGVCDVDFGSNLSNLSHLRAGL